MSNIIEFKKPDKRDGAPDRIYSTPTKNDTFPFYEPAHGTLFRRCNCGCELFFITPDGHLCPNCGIYQSY